MPGASAKMKRMYQTHGRRVDRYWEADEWLLPITKHRNKGWECVRWACPGKEFARISSVIGFPCDLARSCGMAGCGLTVRGVRVPAEHVMKGRVGFEF